MSWTETYHCDVCNKAKGESPDWWLAWRETIAPTAGSAPQPVLRITPWHEFLSHSADVKHLCGARCAQTQLDRWMSDLNE
jgi:hypothetical protein